MVETKYQRTKTIACRENGRSADFTSGNFILGCIHKQSDFYDNPCSYCYVARWGRKALYINVNTEEILEQCDLAIVNKPWPKVPNQVDDTYYYVDIACDVDINKHWLDYDWFRVFDYFKEHDKLAATWATKWTNNRLLQYEPNHKIRIRMSLMPEKVKNVLENGTSPIINRIKFLEKLFQTGYSTHINFSPIVYTSTWLEDYKELFHIINNEVSNDFKSQCGLECIFLTHNENLHNINLQKGLIEQEELLWQPNIQENKVSQYGGNNIRYKYQLKQQWINQFISSVNEELKIPIRYIF